MGYRIALDANSSKSFLCFFDNFFFANKSGLLRNVWRREFSSFHKTPKENTSFSFKPKMKDDKKEGFSFTLTKMPKEGEKKSYSISFTFGESKFLKQFLLTALSMYSSASIKENNEAIAKSIAAKNNQ